MELNTQWAVLQSLTAACTGPELTRGCVSQLLWQLKQKRIVYGVQNHPWPLWSPLAFCGHCPWAVLKHKNKELEQNDTEIGENQVCWVRHPKKKLKSNSLFSLLSRRYQSSHFHCLPELKKLSPPLSVFWTSLSFHHFCDLAVSPLPAAQSTRLPQPPPTAGCCAPESSPGLSVLMCSLGKSQLCTSPVLFRRFNLICCVTAAAR